MKKINLIMWLAGFLVIVLGIMALTRQSKLVDLDSIEEYAEETNFDDLDRELIDIENELNVSY